MAHGARVARFGADDGEVADVTAPDDVTAPGGDVDVAADSDGGLTAGSVAVFGDLEPGSGAASAPVAGLGDVRAGRAVEPVAELGGIADTAAPAGRTARWDGTAVAGRSGRPRAAAVAEPRADRRRTGSEPAERPRRRPVVSAEPEPEPGSGPPDVDTERTPARARQERRSGPRQVDPDADPVSAAREICLRLLSDRSRTRQELAHALRRRGVPDEAAASVLERFDEVGLIDDAAFAGQWVRSRHNHRGLARRAIAMELRRKGVDDEVASEALAEVDPDSETRRARELVDRKLRSLTVDTPEKRVVATRRLVGMLARKGYGGATAYGVVRDALAAHGADDDEFGLEPVDE